MRRWIKRGLLGGVGALLVAQAVPYGRDHSNPPVTAEPAWPSQRVRALANRACFDCHSNATRWPWYSHIAPMSWLVQRDVDQGRRRLNYSEWDRRPRAAHEAAEELEKGEMPPWFYLPLHAEARLSDSEKAELVAGLRALAPPRGPSEPDDHGYGRRRDR